MVGLAVRAAPEGAARTIREEQPLLQARAGGLCTAPAALLDRIRSPEDLRRLPREQLPAVAAALRQGILEAVSTTGGHLGASLGAVELATALHYAFDTPRDRLLWDVGHQAYPHKFLTGRGRAFAGIGQRDGIAKFLRRCESPYDVFGAGHAGTSISAALGIAEAIRRRGGRERAVAVIGDGALTAGMAYEALNHAGALAPSNLVVVLNDNGMSISPNVGALARHLGEGGSRPALRRLRAAVRRLLDLVSVAEDELGTLAREGEAAVKRCMPPASWFEALGFRAIGPVDGHDLPALVEVFSDLRNRGKGQEPVLVHCKTEKGHGYEPAAADPVRYHGVTPFELNRGLQAKPKGPAPSWTSVFASSLIELAGEDERIVGITAAMADGTGLSRFREVHPDRFYDVGIAEQHAVTLAAGMATEGLKPVCAIYSTFLQRAYDQIVHDVCVQNLDVTFALDRAGLVGADGATHQGLYDFSYLRALPNMVVMAPKDENELRRMLCTALVHPGPAALRFPRGTGLGVPIDEEIRPLPIGEGELLRNGADVALVAVGRGVAIALDAARILDEEGIDVAVLNARFVKPLDAEQICDLAGRVRALVTIEEHASAGGFGEAVVGLLSRHELHTPARILAVPDRVVEHGDPAALLASFGLDAEGVAGSARVLLDRASASSQRPAPHGRLPRAGSALSGPAC